MVIKGNVYYGYEDTDGRLEPFGSDHPAALSLSVGRIFTLKIENKARPSLQRESTACAADSSGHKSTIQNL